MGFRECATEIARYLSTVEGLDLKDPLYVRALSHMENFLAQRELAINAAVAASVQMGVPKVAPPPTVSIPVSSHPYAPLTPPRASPDNLSPPANFTGEAPLPRFNLAFPTPIISFASTATVPAFGTVPSSFKPVVQPAACSTTTTNVILNPMMFNTIVKAEQTIELPHSPTKTATKAPFRPWADTTTTNTP